MTAKRRQHAYAALREKIDSGDYDAAIVIARRTLKQKRSDVPSTLRASLALGQALAIKGHSQEARATLEAAFKLAKRNHLSEFAAEALHWLSTLALNDLDGKNVRACAERMMELAIPATSGAAFRLFVGKATQAVQLGDTQRAAKILEEAERVSREADIDSFASYLSLKSCVLTGAGRPEEALGYAQLASDITANRPDLWMRWRFLAGLAYALQESGRLAQAFNTYVLAEDVARKASLTWEIPLTQSLAAWNALLLGRITVARDLVCESFASLHAERWMRALRSSVGIFVGLYAGDEELIWRSADDELFDSVIASGDYHVIGPLIAAFHACRLHTGQQSKGSELLELGISNLPSAHCCWVLFPAVARHGSDAAIRRAEELLDRFPRTHRVAEAYRQFFSALLAARRGQRELSESRAGQAQLLFADFGCELFAAECLELGGRIGEAYQRYQAMGATGEAQRIAAARARRGRPRRSYEASRERREILKLLLEGLTSASVAERLGVSERTIKSRIADIYDFEGVSSRAELFARHNVPRRMA